MLFCYKVLCIDIIIFIGVMEKLENVKNQIKQSNTEETKQYCFEKIDNNEESKKFYYEVMNELPEVLKNNLLRSIQKSDANVKQWNPDGIHYLWQIELNSGYIVKFGNNRLGMYVAKNTKDKNNNLNPAIVELSVRFLKQYQAKGLLNDTAYLFIDKIFKENNQCKQMLCKTTNHAIVAVAKQLNFQFLPIPGVRDTNRTQYKVLSLTRAKYNEMNENNDIVNLLNLQNPSKQAML